MFTKIKNIFNNNFENKYNKLKIENKNLKSLLSIRSYQINNLKKENNDLKYIIKGIRKGNKGLF